MGIHVTLVKAHTCRLLIRASSEIPPEPGSAIGLIGSTRQRMSSLQKLSSLCGPHVGVAAML